ncbi:MAG: anti-sigma factor family protein, partial [Planctomycetota bacterium]
MNCTTTQELFSDYADGGLRPEERRLLEEHLAACAPCAREFRYFTESLKALRELPAVETTRFFLPNVKAAAAAHLRRTAALESDPATAAVTVVTPRAEPVPARRRWVFVPVAAGVLAAFALGLALGGRGRIRELHDRLRALEAARTRAAEPPPPAP